MNEFRMVLRRTVRWSQQQSGKQDNRENRVIDAEVVR